MRIRRGWILGSALLVVGAAPAPQPPGFALSMVVLPGSAQRLQAGDLDADGDLDLLVFSADTGAVPLAVLLNSAGHGFAPGWSDSLASVTPFHRADLDLADLDVDGDLDAVATIPYAVAQSRLNAGNASFPTFKFLAGGPRVQNSLALLDGDAIPDLSSYDIDILGYVGGHKGLGDGGFSQVTDKLVNGFGSDFATQAELGDVTGDSVADLVRVDFQGLHYTVGVATTGFPGWGADVHPLGSPAADVALADVDADGRLDAVTTVPASNAIEVYRSQPGGLQFGTPFPGGAKPGPLALADMDADGFLDVIVASQSNPTIAINSGSAGGVFLDLARYRAGGGATDILSADLDADGDQDLAESLGDGRVLLMFNKLVP
jgi:hypothetical protein